MVGSQRLADYYQIYVIIWVAKAKFETVMNKPQANLSKVCSSCGTEKPLHAFLQFGDSKQPGYGNICAECRSKNAQNSPAQDEGRDGEHLSLEYKIDNKAKMQNELEKKRHWEKIDEDYRKDREKLEKERVNIHEKEQAHHHQEKKHREQYLERASFLGSSKIQESKRQQTVQHSNAAQIHAQHVKEEHLQKNLDTIAPFLDTQIAGKEKFTKGIAIKEFATRLGKSAPIFSVATQQKNHSANSPTPEEVLQKNWYNKSKR